MKIKNKLSIAIFVCVIFCFVLTIWSFVPMVGPILGIRRTPDEILRFIKDRHIILLVNPEPIINEKDAGYHDWAYEELMIRRNVSVVTWIVCATSLSFWSTRKTKKR